MKQRKEIRNILSLEKKNLKIYKKLYKRIDPRFNPGFEGSTCSLCEICVTCKFAFDPYNSNEECLASK